MAGCAEVKKPAAQLRAAVVGSRFDQVGSVTLYAGEPCTSQIMFDFHGAGSTVWLAARRRETEILTDAAKKNRGVPGRTSRGDRHGRNAVTIPRKTVWPLKAQLRSSQPEAWAQKHRRLRNYCSDTRSPSDASLD